MNYSIPYLCSRNILIQEKKFTFPRKYLSLLSSTEWYDLKPQIALCETSKSETWKTDLQSHFVDFIWAWRLPRKFPLNKLTRSKSIYQWYSNICSFFYKTSKNFSFKNENSKNKLNRSLSLWITSYANFSTKFT